VEERATLRYQGDEIMELGIFSFGDVQRDPNSGALGSTADAVGNLREAIALADAVGLDYFGVGEHHTYEMPASADERSDRWVLRGLKVLAFLWMACAQSGFKEAKAECNTIRILGFGLRELTLIR
jgi:hypothetical protein